MAKLNDCPCCGSKAVVSEEVKTIGHGVVEAHVKQFTVGCSKCPLQIKPVEDYYTSSEMGAKEIAIEYWNRLCT